ncbi:NAD(P)-binding protein [Rhodocytophaga rosea]|uniref:NAD(P)-binding protein n=1 Tax=Rhodocytophaga rosea TaxID=2704465 RepID=A0A6C0GBW3_9BACT|nr:NAD(P)-binding protein [Rhodocytophaga rosea]QHT65334.1 NAD(P)-binding protein [Rhodocytophaga rosea]
MSLSLKKFDFSTLQTDIAIVGAGISGLYSGWRLLNGEFRGASRYSGMNPTVSIFEMSNRVGGRLFSVKNYPGMTNIVAELGA